MANLSVLSDLHSRSGQSSLESFLKNHIYFSFNLGVRMNLTSSSFFVRIFASFSFFLFFLFVIKFKTCHSCSSFRVPYRHYKFFHSIIML